MNKNPQLTLGQLIAEAQKIADKGYRCHDGSEPTVEYGFGQGFIPTTIDSWRGSYKELALDYKHAAKPMPLSEFLKLLKFAVSYVFEGYKGGQYEMTEETPVWVANYGDGGNTAVVGLHDDGYRVVILTEYHTF